MKKSVLLGMSGGIDSTVAALLLLEQGYEVTGITFLFSGENKDNDPVVTSAACLAKDIGIKQVTVDLRKEFENLVIQYFIDAYSSGQTPFPCAVCNPLLKFSRLNDFAMQLGCRYISTGHYARIIEYQDDKYIGAGIDADKDQSFFLWGLKKDILEKVLFPLGDHYKAEVKKIARQKSLHFLSGKKESLGLCFTGGRNYREYLALRGIVSHPGYFVDESGTRIGKHDGLIHYTVGQRKGLKLRVNKPLFVNEINPLTNEIILSDYNSLFRKTLILHHTNFVGSRDIDHHTIYTIKIRYRKQENRCRIKRMDENRAVVELLEPVAMVAKGQTAVLYENGRVIGGGFIENSLKQTAYGEY